MSANTFLPPSPVAPKFLLISNITQANPMVVTVTTDNEYVIDQLAYFSIPFDYGMFQLDGLTGKVINVDSTNLVLTFNINSTQFDAFTTPSAGVKKERPASLSPAGSRNLTNFNTNIRIVPFHSIDGQIGN